MTPGVVTVLILLGLWGRHMWRWPYVTCSHCEGKKRKYASDEQHFQDVDCSWCLSQGYRYRWELRWLSVF